MTARRVALGLVCALAAVGCGPSTLLLDLDPHTLDRVTVVGTRHAQWVRRGGRDDDPHARVVLGSIDARHGHVAYAVELRSDRASDGRRVAVVHDGRVVARNLRGVFRVVLTDDGKSVAYVAETKHGMVVGLDGAFGPTVDRIDARTLVVDEEGAGAFAVGASADGRFVVGASTILGPYESVVQLVARRRGAAFVARGGRDRALDTSGRLLVEASRVEGLCAVGSSWAALVAHETGRSWVVDAGSGSPVGRDVPASGELVSMACDSTGRVAARVRLAEGMSLLTDRGLVGPFESVEPPVVRGGHVAYVGHRGGRSVVGLDEQTVADEPYATGVALAASAPEVAYAARRDGRNGVVHRGVFHRAPGLVADTLVLDADGGAFAALVQVEGRGMHWLDASGALRPMPRGWLRLGPPRAGSESDDVARLLELEATLLARRPEASVRTAADSGAVP